jgi:hypothetical protein
MTSDRRTPRGAARLGTAALAALALSALGLGCSSVARRVQPLEGYRAATEDAPPFEEARDACQRENAFHDARGTLHTDWDGFERCMEQRGWTREPAE